MILLALARELVWKLKRKDEDALHRLSRGGEGKAVEEEKEEKYTGGQNGRLRGGGEGLTGNIPHVMFQGGPFFMRGNMLSFRKKIPLYKMKDIGIRGTLMRSF